MGQTVKVAIVGAGTAGLSALKVVQRHTDDFILIDPGPLGTTCARIGCMPSKALIEAANEFHKRHFMPELGISNARQLRIESREVMKRVRLLRDRFVQSPVKAAKNLGERYISEQAVFEDARTLRVGETRIKAEKIILATGSKPIIPEAWQHFDERILTSERLFELEKLPESIAIVGLGGVGLELGLALSRLGVQVIGIEQGERLAGISDPDVSHWALESLSTEFPIYMGHQPELDRDAGQITIQVCGERVRVSAVLAAMGRRPGVLDMNFAATGLPVDSQGIPCFDPDTLQVADSGIFIAGDTSGGRAQMHESADEGRIAAYSALSEYHNGIESGDGVKKRSEDDRQDSRGLSRKNGVPVYQRRVPMSIVFTDPQIASFGARYDALDLSQTAIGSADFSFQNRALIMGVNRGVVKLYADRKSRKLLGGEMLVPKAEHFAFQLATCVHNGMTVDEIAHLPFYHPTMEEGLRSALYHLGEELGGVLPEHFLPYKTD